MTVRIAALGAVLFYFACSGVHAAPIDHWFSAANERYEKQQYDSAAILYEKIIEAGIQNSAVHYNLGNAYFRLHKLGPAILNYEKARALSPGDSDIKANLRFAQLTIVDRAPEPALSFLETILARLHTLFSLNVQLWIALCTLLLLSLSYSLGLFVSYNVRLWLVYLGSICFLLTSILAISIGVKVYTLESKHYAVVLEKSVDAKNQPDGDKIMFTAHEGTKFLVKKTVDTWSYVSLPNGYTGWVENSSLGKI
jgi:tetratricopeptide (TPR) repeat protein